MNMTVAHVQHVRRYPPRVTQFTAPFWQGLTHGEFRTTRCGSCQRLSFPPKPICPHCWTDKVAWESIAVDGRLYSWTRIHAGPAVFAPDLPYEVGIVDLTVGLRLACSLHGVTVEWKCDMAVQLVTVLHIDGPLFAARPM